LWYNIAVKVFGECTQSGCGTRGLLVVGCPLYKERSSGVDAGEFLPPLLSRCFHL